ncbi:MAG: DUF642 domain-containing protein [Verrucomicrobiae bacterium]|nr:DUF642 domain-containing protein [Verrucomicrobiae bacterium]
MRLSFALLTLALACSCAAAHQKERPALNEIDSRFGEGSGSFEAGAFQPDPRGSMVLSDGSRAVRGWIVQAVGGGARWVAAPNFPASDGKRALDLNGARGSAVVCSIPTENGAAYEISFDAYGGSRTGTGAVSAGTLMGEVFKVSGAEAGAPKFTRISHSFLALSDTTEIEIRGLAGGEVGPIIDNVQVSRVDEAGRR